MIADAARRQPGMGAGGVQIAGLAGFMRRLDWVLLTAVLALVGYGLWAISGVTRFDVPGDPDFFLRRQAIAAAIGLAGLVFAAMIPPLLYARLWRPIFIATVGVMIVVYLAADPIRGSRRWIELGPFQFQASEFGKLLFVLAITGYLVERRDRLGLQTLLTAIGLGGIPIALVFLQPDLGTALVYAAALVAMTFLVGARWGHVGLLGGTAILTAVVVVWLLPGVGLQVLKPYQVDRLVGFTDPSSDPSGTTYNVNQSITAVGSGGLSGRGIEEASQTRFAYLPEHETDFVFAAFSEQRGFLGAALLLLLFLLVVWRGLRIVTIAPDLYSAVVAGAVTFAFAFQVFVNVGMTMGVAPVTGIPLPFVTVGGSSMVANLLTVGVLLAIHARGRAARRP